ncbi:MAG: hypothetical protein J3Q66DRAFT_396529 [Benniella sp.]|nr:MAG: hypothetical protein J3Q66DRAFT_396529 [Benniella sp.]
METETSILPPRTRLSELKSSADIPTEEFNHSIKTWVNMASLLVKQGNTAELSDDESAYISYVRACLIITKIIPQQALYHSMMNDIVCIDLRQKILGVISRTAYLERKLLKRFEQENQERLAMLANEALPTTALTTTTKSILSSPPSGKTCTSGLQSSLKAVIDLCADRSIKEQENDDLLFLRKSVYRRHYSTKEEGMDESGNEIEDCTEMKFDVPASTNLASSSDDSSNRAEPASTLKKKSSNDDERTLLTPECQPNLIISSTLSPSQYDSAHVRRCSSSDTIRKSVQFPVSCQSVVAAAAPAIPPRSQKRSSTLPMARTSSSNSNNSVGSVHSISRRTTTCESNTFNHNASSTASVTSSEAVDYSTMPKIAQAYMLRKSNSISLRNRPDPQPTPLSVENLPNTADGLSSSASLSASMSLSSASWGSSNPVSSVSSTCSSPFASPQPRITSPLLPNGNGQAHSLTSVLSGQTAVVDTSSRSLLSSSSTSSFTCNSTSSPSTPDSSPLLNAVSPQAESQPQPQPQPQQKQTMIAASPTLTSPSYWSTSGNTTSSGSMKAGLLRKIRSRPKMKDQVFEIVASPSLTPAHTTPSSTSPALVHLQHQQKLVV